MLNGPWLIIGLIEAQAMILLCGQEIGEEACLPVSGLTPRVHYGVLPDDSGQDVPVIYWKSQDLWFCHRHRSVRGVEIDLDKKQRVRRNDCWKGVEHLRGKRSRRWWRIEGEETCAQGALLLLGELFHQAPPMLWLGYAKWRIGCLA